MALEVDDTRTPTMIRLTECPFCGHPFDKQNQRARHLRRCTAFREAWR